MKILNRSITVIVETLITVVAYCIVVTSVVENTYIVVAYNRNIFPAGNYMFEAVIETLDQGERYVKGLQ